MDLTLFRKHLAKVQKIELTEEHNNHAGIKNDFSHRDYGKTEGAANITNSELTQVKTLLQSMPGVYEVFVKKDLNTIHTQAYYDYDDSLPFVIQMRMLVSKISRSDSDRKFNAVYEYRLVARSEGTPQFLKKYRPSKAILSDGGANVLIGDLKQLTPFPKAHISGKISSWKSRFAQSSK